MVVRHGLVQREARCDLTGCRAGAVELGDDAADGLPGSDVPARGVAAGVPGDLVAEGTRRRRASSSDRPRSFPLTTLRWYSRNPSRVSRSEATATRSSSSVGGGVSVTRTRLRPQILRIRQFALRGWAVRRPTLDRGLAVFLAGQAPGHDDDGGPVDHALLMSRIFAPGCRTRCWSGRGTGPGGLRLTG